MRRQKQWKDSEYSWYSIIFKNNPFLRIKISFGGIPNSSSIDILMPYAIFDYMAAFLHSGFAHVDNVIPVIKTITWLLLSRLQGNKPHRNSAEPSEPCLRTVRNCPEPSKPCLRNLHQPNPPEPTVRPTSGTYRQHTPEPSEILRNLPKLASGTYTNLPEPSGTVRNLLRNLLLRPAPAHTGAYLGWRPH